MRQRDLIDRRVSSLEMLDRMKELRVFAQCTSDRAQAPDVLGMPPARVVTVDTAMGDERGPHGRRYSTGRRRRSVIRKVQPWLAAVDEMGAFSGSRANPFGL